VSVASLAPYQFAARDARANFALPLLFVGWDEHMMFGAPLAVPMNLDTPFADIPAAVLPRLYSEHPDFARIDWTRVQWFQSDRMFTPRADATLAAHGFKHKSVLRFRTPGLEGIKGSCG
jgi:phenol/toluene 2-monooxygenase (NADH) P4/A4